VKVCPPTFEAWDLVALRTKAHQLCRDEDDVRWTRGYLLLAVRSKYGDEALADLMEDLNQKRGFTYERLNQERWMAGCYPPATRVPKLTFTHHRLAATMVDPDRKEALEHALATRMTTRAFEEYLRDLLQKKAGPLPFADPIEMERDQYVLRRLGETCDNVPETFRDLVGKATIRALDEWYDAQTRASEGMAAA
jgi:hypothetical protein